MTVPSDLFREPAEEGRTEEKIQRSLFIAQLEPCRTEDEARAFIGRVQALHHNATHNCWAWLLGPDPLSGYSSDDGEPSGTAGRPILGAIKKSGLVNAAVVVTRYFGGIKLGVRGLIEAYGGAASAVLDSVPAKERTRVLPVKVDLPYASIGTVTRLLGDHEADRGQDWTYEAEVRVRAFVPLSRAESLAARLDEMAAQRQIAGWSRGEAPGAL